MTLSVRGLTPDLWPELERLFGPRGATAGCWCQWVRLEKGERFDDIKGEIAHGRLREEVCSGARRGQIAVEQQRPCRRRPRPAETRLPLPRRVRRWR